MSWLFRGFIARSLGSGGSDEQGLGRSDAAVTAATGCDCTGLQHETCQRGYDTVARMSTNTSIEAVRRAPLDEQGMRTLQDHERKLTGNGVRIKRQTMTIGVS